MVPVHGCLFPPHHHLEQRWFRPGRDQEKVFIITKYFPQALPSKPPTAPPQIIRWYALQQWLLTRLTQPLINTGPTPDNHSHHVHSGGGKLHALPQLPWSGLTDVFITSSDLIDHFSEPVHFSLFSFTFAINSVHSV